MKKRFQNLIHSSMIPVAASTVFLLCFMLVLAITSSSELQPTRSILIQSENASYTSKDPGSWQVEKSGEWVKKGVAQVQFDVDTTLMTNNQYTDIIFVLDISGSMSGDKLERVKQDTEELIESLLSDPNNRAALITFDSTSSILSNLTNDQNSLLEKIDSLAVTGSTNYYQALVNVDTILKDYQKEEGREMIVLFLTDGYPNVDIPNEVAYYHYLKSEYPYITVNGIQYEMGSSILEPIQKVSDYQYLADMETLNNVLFDASVAPVIYDNFQIIDYIDHDYFTLESVDDITVSEGSVKLEVEDERQKITWTMDSFRSGSTANLTMNLKLKEEYLGEGGIYPTNEKEEVISKIEDIKEDVSSVKTPILSDNYQVIYEGNAPDGCSVEGVPDAKQYSVFDTVEVSSNIPTCEGYQFKGWDIITDGVQRLNDDYFIMAEKDVVLRAEWGRVGIAKSMDGVVNTKGDSIMRSYTYDSVDDYHNSAYRSKVTSIVTKGDLQIPTTAIEYWDVSEAGDGSVIAYIEDDGRGEGTYQVTIGGQGEIIANPSSSYLFYQFTNVESMDLSYLDTSRVTNMGSMFCDCSSLTSLDLSKFNTTMVTSMTFMFQNCSSLTSLVLNQFNTANVTNMQYMFYNCKNLTSIDVSSFTTGNVTNMEAMFAYCSSLTSLDVSKFDTTNVTAMGSMFYNCSSLTSLDLSKFDTLNVADIAYMFSYCSNLTSLDFRNAVFNSTTYIGMFSYANSFIQIFVKDTVAKSWIEMRFSEAGLTSSSAVIVGS